MKEDNLYTKILLWAYKKGFNGFTEEELESELHIAKIEFKRWRLIFFNGTNDDRPLICKMKEEGGVSYFALSDKGLSAAIDYIELKEARESSRRAIYIAVASFMLAFAVGIAQILVSIRTQNTPHRNNDHCPNYIMWFK